eukprot:CAMPEP_0116129452 /NCGR_PEP_ID=MMETSP0329-20121206/7931_1 /TAXON_ID=697910 /ORGANISM="Pseudo-nitzschia arenysensis, Strain B593" /LENGTH=686 /DNA_ID=CAMNT_0003623719 /DNA_START=161 /DNA_END=2222 /DNA_ORIENTATION=+
MANKTSQSTSHDDILDSFLTTIESKLRGPFSSLDLAKAVSTAALRQSSQIGSSNAHDNSNDPAREYLNNLSSVFNRTNKVIQCRMLIGLLGLNDMRTNKNDASSNNNADSKNTNQYLTPEILRILHETQEGSNEDWVRTTSGLIEGVMFRTNNGSDNGNTRESCRGKEAASTIRETGTEVCEKVESQIQNVAGHTNTRAKKQQASSTKGNTGKNSEENKKSSAPISAVAANKRNRGFAIEKVKASSSRPAIKKEEPMQVPIKQEQNSTAITRTEPTPPDLNACFAPYRYCLIPTPVLNTIIPEFELSKEESNANGISNSNCHFKVNASANILKVDLHLEAQRAKEHGSNVATKSNSDSKVKKDPAMSNTGKGSFPPGFRPAKLVGATGAASRKVGASKVGARSGGGSSSLFMPKQKRPANLFNTTTKFRPQPAKTMLRRKAGGAQALLKNNATSSSGGAILNKLGSSGGTTSGSMATARARPGGVGRFSANRNAARAGVGRTSRMKMIDDDDVDTKNKLRQSNAASNMTAAELRASKRKRILEKAARRGIHGSGGATGGTGSSFGNQLRKKQKLSPRGIKREEQTPTSSSQEQQNSSEWWQTLLRERSNKMSGDDRDRVEKFFTASNATERSALLSPSEGGPVYKMKIHEQRGKDPSTGQDIKETFYLELDYDTGSSNQSKKVKRY